MVKPKSLDSDFVASAIVKEAQHHGAVLLPAARGRIAKAIGMGSVPEQKAIAVLSSRFFVTCARVSENTMLKRPLAKAS